MTMSTGSSEAGVMERTPGAEPFISVQQLRHAYDNRTALNGVSFDVYPAEIFGLLGPVPTDWYILVRLVTIVSAVHYHRPASIAARTWLVEADE